MSFKIDQVTDISMSRPQNVPLCKGRHPSPLVVIGLHNLYLCTTNKDAIFSDRKSIHENEKKKQMLPVFALFSVCVHARRPTILSISHHIGGLR